MNNVIRSEGQMKNKVLKWFILFAVLICFTVFPLHNGIRMVKASAVSTVNQIMIIQKPLKTTYVSGESLDLTGLIVQAAYSDGTTNTIMDYNVYGYDSSHIGAQTVFVTYQNCTAVFDVTVTPRDNIPAKVTNITAINPSASSITLTWDVLPDVTRYDVYALDSVTGTYVLKTYTMGNSVTLDYNPGTVQSFKICGVKVEMGGAEHAGPFSDVYTAATSPGTVTDLIVTGTTSSTVTLSWSAVDNADGYIIYRRNEDDNEFTRIQSVTTLTYTDQQLSSGQVYEYKVYAYNLNEIFYGEASSVVDTCTNLAKMVLKSKPGDQKIRITWKACTDASSYDLYMKDGSSEFSLLTTIKKSSTTSYIAEGLTTDKTYSFYAIAHRTYNGTAYDSEASDTLDVLLTKIRDTSTKALLYSNKAKFQKSSSYKYINYFKKNVNYKKSIAIPGMITTNIAGFSSTEMCPQGICFAKNYLLITAYDLLGEENSVIYVMDKNTKKLMTTLVLPSKVHAGGLCFDGVNVWITSGRSLAAIPYAQINELAQKGNAYAQVEYISTCNLGVTASYVTYYNKKLWVGSYNELSTTKMYSYSIEDKNDDPYLTREENITMPTRVQGIAFTKSGYLILSRSCQTRKGRRGYLRLLALYKPDLSGGSEISTVSLGKCLNTVGMPSMNEGIAVNGSYVYVIYESAAFEESTFKMDRICAFKGSSLKKKTTVDKK
jgi:fibronectin type 3 domain-containing protein